MVPWTPAEPLSIGPKLDKVQDVLMRDDVSSNSYSSIKDWQLYLFSE